MRIRRTHRRSKEITNVHCAICQAVCEVERLEIQMEMPTFTLTCGHEVMLTPGTIYGLNVQDEAITLYPNPNDLLMRHEAIS